jgi:TolB-like protein
MKITFSELRRRHVVRVGIAYVVVAWLVLQLVNNIVTPLHLPEWTSTLVIVLLGIGFPIALVLAWAFEMTPEGVKRSAAAPEKAKSVAEAAPDALTAAIPSTPSIAVLPFADMSPDKDQEYFSDGLTEELLNRLVTFKGLRVIGRTSAFAFKGKNEDLRTIGETLGVNHILEGSVRKSGNHLRITAQLINPSDGSHFWSKTFDRDLTDIFEIQEEISRAVAEALAVTMGVAAGEDEGFTRSVEAYEEYLKGKALVEATTLRDIPRGIEHLLRATEIDPNFAAPWGSLSQAYMLGAQTGTSKAAEWRRNAFEANDRLQAMAPNSVIAAWGGLIAASNRGQWFEAETKVKRLQGADFTQSAAWNSQYGRFLINVGRPGEAVGYLERARRGDPLSPTTSHSLGEAYADSGNLSAALEELDRGATLGGLLPLTAGSALLTALAIGDIALIEKRAQALAETDPAAGSLSGTWAALAGDKPVLRAALRKAAEVPGNRTGFRAMAVCHWAAYAGEIELSLDVFDGLDTGFIALASWRPVMREVRRHPRFKDIMRKINLVDYWRKSGNWPEFCQPVGDNDFECE